jgi:hypothetical protein
MGKAGWFVLVGLIGFLVFCSIVALQGIDAYQYRARIDQVMATSPYPAAFPGHGKISLYDPLSERNQWLSDDNNSKSSCQYVDNAYHIHTTQVSNCKSKRTFSEFAFSANMTIIKGDCGGIFFSLHYGFGVCANGHHSLYEYKYGNGQVYVTNLIGEFYRPDVITSPKQSNELGIVVRGKNIMLFINSQKVGETSLDAVVEGPIGLNAANRSSPLTEVAYKDARVWTF